MATPSTGVGRGVGGGGKQTGAGRPKGSFHKKARALIADAERTGQMLPVDYLLNVMRDPEAPQRDRISAAAIAAPYCHPRLTVMQTFSNPDHLDNAALQAQTRRLEAHAATMPDDPESVTGRIDNTIGDIERLSVNHQEKLFRRLLVAGTAGLQRLNDPTRPGAPPAHRAVQRDEPPRPPLSRPTRSAPQQAPDAAPGRLDGGRFLYDPETQEFHELEPIE